MESTLLIITPPYATLEVEDVSVIDEAYDRNGNINFNDSYLSRALMWRTSPGPNGSVLISPNPGGHPDILFKYDNNGNIEPVPRN